MTRKTLYKSLLAGAFLIGLAGCNDDEFGPSIFQDPSPALDETSATYPLDKFMYDNFLLPYNMRFDYKLLDTEANMNYNLTPASYEKSVDIAVLIKYLWYDVYNKVIEESQSDAANKFFMKTYGPKMIMLVGSSAYNESTQTEERGLSEGGVKVTLYAVDALNYMNLDSLNSLYFRTMHHEFNHILNQTIAFTDDYKEISANSYDAMNWQDYERDNKEEMQRSKGFITAYASKDYTEDFVEVIANYIVNTDEAWNKYLTEAEYGYEETDVPSTGIQAAKADGTYIRTISTTSDVAGNIANYKILRYAVNRNEDGTPARDEEGNLVYLDPDGIDGRAIIEQKLQVCKDYLSQYFGIELDVLRSEVLHRMYVHDAAGQPVLDNGKYVNMLQQTISDGTTIFMDSLRNQVYQYNNEHSIVK